MLREVIYDAMIKVGDAAITPPGTTPYIDAASRGAGAVASVITGNPSPRAYWHGGKWVFKQLFGQRSDPNTARGAATNFLRKNLGRHVARMVGGDVKEGLVTGANEAAEAPRQGEVDPNA